MRKSFKRSTSLVLAVTLLASTVMPVVAATYRAGAQTGPSESYAEGRYYKRFQNIPITGDNRTDLIAVALSQLGYQEGKSTGNFSGEIAGGSNYVEYSYNLGDLGLGYGGKDYPWCAGFVTWCLYQSHCTDQATYRDLARLHGGDDAYIWKEVSCSQWARKLNEAGYYRSSLSQGGSYAPRSGDLVFFRKSGRIAHIGICLYTTDDRIYTIEGNTSDSSDLDTNGGGVYLKEYDLSASYIDGYGALPYISKDSIQKIDYSGSAPTTGLYISSTPKYIYASPTATSRSYVMNRFTIFEVTKICSNGRLKVKATERGGSTVTGYIANNSDRVFQISCVDSCDTARAELEEAVKEAQNIRHYRYSDDTVMQIRSAYEEAMTLLHKSHVSEGRLEAAAEDLRTLLDKNGTPKEQYVYINGKNQLIQAGDCFLYTSDWNDGVITAENANIRYTLNVVCGWDEERQINVVKSISEGTGSSTPPIRLDKTEFLIACHDWETGIPEHNEPVEYSGTNFAVLNSLHVGDGIRLSGIDPSTGDTGIALAAFLQVVKRTDWENRDHSTDEVVSDDVEKILTGSRIKVISVKDLF